jgi:hypothetical protein
MTVCLVVVARYVPQLRFVTVLLADQPVLTPAERIYQRLLAFDYQECLKIAQNYLRTASLQDFYDQVLIPALVLAEDNRHRDQLNDDQAAFVHDAAGDLVLELGESVFAAHAVGSASDEEATDKPAAEDAPTEHILCVPLRDEADEIASHMLGQLLSAEGFQVETDAAESLTGEIVDHVGKSECDLVVISILPPIRPRESRLLWKRLRQRFPELPIIVGYWIGAEADGTMPRLHADESSKLATTLAEAVRLVRSTTAQRRVSQAV